MGKFLRVPDTFCWVNQQMTWLVGPTAWSACTTWSDQLLLAVLVLVQVQRPTGACARQVHSAEGQLGSVEQHLEINANSFVSKSKCENYIASCTGDTLYRKGWSNQVTQ